MVEYFKGINKQPVELKNVCFLCLKSLATELMYKKKHIPQFSLSSEVQIYQVVSVKLLNIQSLINIQRGVLNYTFCCTRQMESISKLNQPSSKNIWLLRSSSKRNLTCNLNTSKDVKTPQLQVLPVKYNKASGLNVCQIEVIFEFLEKWKLVRQLHCIFQLTK